MRGMRRMTAVESDRRKIEEAYLKAVDIGYSYHLAKKMEEFKSNPGISVHVSFIKTTPLCTGGIHRPYH